MSAYTKLQPHFPHMTMNELEAMIGGIWDMHKNRTLDAEGFTTAENYINDHFATEYLGWNEGEWLERAETWIDAYPQRARELNAELPACPYGTNVFMPEI